MLFCNVTKQVHEGLKQGPRCHCSFFYKRGQDFDNTDLSLRSTCTVQKANVKQCFYMSFIDHDVLYKSIKIDTHVVIQVDQWDRQPLKIQFYNNKSYRVSSCKDEFLSR